MITFIIKGTDGCNLRCKYCSIGEKKSDYNLINTDTLKLAGDFIVRKAEELGDNKIHIILHGGEPTLVSPQIYCDFFNYLLKTYTSISFDFSMQTNGYYFTDETIALIKEFDISIGISIDGDEKTHDSMRVDCNNKGTFPESRKILLGLKKRI